MAVTLDDLDGKLDAIDSKLTALEQMIEGPRALTSTCPRCDGSTEINQYEDGEPYNVTQVTCPLCSGDGKIVLGILEAL